MSRVLISALVLSCLLGFGAVRADESVVKDLKVTILSTMVTEFWGVGEWGFAALVEMDGQRLLFDTGARPETVLHNARELNIDITTVENVFLSHNHWDHSGGLVTLRRAVMQQQASALSRVHVGEGIFTPRVMDQEALAKLPNIPREYLVSIMDVREDYLALGGEFVQHATPHELMPGVWITGPIPRVHPEKNWTPFMKIRQGDGLIEDDIPEDQALVINTEKGLVIVAGCGHAGIVNTMEYARKIAGDKPVHAVIGGFHMMSLTEEKVSWTGKRMQELGVQNIVGAHCTGINAVQGLRDAAALGRSSAVVGTVGSVFTVENGVQRGFLNR